MKFSECEIGRIVIPTGMGRRGNWVIIGVAKPDVMMQMMEELPDGSYTLNPMGGTAQPEWLDPTPFSKWTFQELRIGRRIRPLR